MGVAFLCVGFEFASPYIDSQLKLEAAIALFKGGQPAEDVLNQLNTNPEKLFEPNSGVQNVPWLFTGFLIWFLALGVRMRSETNSIKELFRKLVGVNT